MNMFEAAEYLIGCGSQIVHTCSGTNKIRARKHGEVFCAGCAHWVFRHLTGIFVDHKCCHGRRCDGATMTCSQCVASSRKNPFLRHSGDF